MLSHFRFAPVGGSGFLWNEIPYGTPVITAKAGIQSVDIAFPEVCGVNSRSPAFGEDKFRGNEDVLERPPAINYICFQ